MVFHLLLKQTQIQRTCLENCQTLPYSLAISPSQTINYELNRVTKQQIDRFQPQSSNLAGFPVNILGGGPLKMSNFPDAVADGRRSGKAPEKSNFSQTCSLLSQFLKDKRTSGASTLGMGGKMEPKASTKDFLASLQNSDGALRIDASAMDSLPQLVENPCIKKSNARSSGPGTPQLTIFYDGKMLVFDAFPPDKATEIMELATKLASDNSSVEESPPSAPVAAEKLNKDKVPETNTASETPRPGNQAVGSDMRYPRRASLLKFLEKRKERVIARGPYLINSPNAKQEGSSSGGEPYQINSPNPKLEGSSSGGISEDQCSKHFDLNL